MCKEYDCVLLIMDKLFNSWYIKNTNTGYLYYLEGSGLSGINSKDVVVLGKDFIWVGTWQTWLFKEYYGVLLIMD